MPSSIPPLDVKDRRPLYRQVEDYIESLIHETGLKPGEAIPSLTQLSSTLGVNGLTIRRAIRELTYKQTLVTLQGRGTFVAEGAIKRILWVSGLDLFSEETSASYSNLFRAVALECENHSLRLEPVWLSKERDFEATIDANGGDAAISGYFFSACEEDHRLFQHVRQTGKPYISTSLTMVGKPHTCLPNLDQADRMASEYFRKKKAQRISYFYLGGPTLNPYHWHDELADPQYILWRYGGNRLKVESYAYLKTQELIRTRKLANTIYVTDDVAARGVTRALLDLSPRKRDAFDILVRTRLQDITPLGIPVSYLTYDIREQARYAMEMLLHHIKGEEKVIQHLCPFQLLEKDSPRLKKIENELVTLMMENRKPAMI